MRGWWSNTCSNEGRIQQSAGDRTCNFKIPSLRLSVLAHDLCKAKPQLRILRSTLRSTDRHPHMSLFKGYFKHKGIHVWMPVGGPLEMLVGGT